MTGPLTPWNLRKIEWIFFLSNVVLGREGGGKKERKKERKKDMMRQHVPKRYCTLRY
jgi:hypothetical protein